MSTLTIEYLNSTAFGFLDDIVHLARVFSSLLPTMLQMSCPLTHSSSYLHDDLVGRTRKSWQNAVMFNMMLRMKIGSGPCRAHIVHQIERLKGAR
jgi:hypothetical protein